MLSLLFGTKGGIRRQDFWIGLGLIVLIVFAYNSTIRYFGPGSLPTFWLIILGLPTLFYMISCVYAKRLTDMGRTRWIFTGAIALEFLIILILMLSFGGAEYFSEFAAYDRKEDIDPEQQQAIIQAYQDRQAANMHIIKPAMYIVPVALSLWLAIAPSKQTTA